MVSRRLSRLIYVILRQGPGTVFHPPSFSFGKLGETRIGLTIFKGRFTPEEDLQAE